MTTVRLPGVVDDVKTAAFLVRNRWKLLGMEVSDIERCPSSVPSSSPL